MVVVALCGSRGEEETAVNAERLCSSCSEERALPVRAHDNEAIRTPETVVFCGSLEGVVLENIHQGIRCD